MRSKSTATRRISSIRPQPIKVPSHYVFLLITKEMASSPLRQPAGDIRGLIGDDRVRDSSFSAKESCSEFRAQFFLGIDGGTERRGFANPFSRKAFLAAGTMN